MKARNLHTLENIRSPDGAALFPGNFPCKVCARQSKFYKRPRQGLHGEASFAEWNSDLLLALEMLD
jgi:hypothetical protein